MEGKLNESSGLVSPLSTVAAEMEARSMAAASVEEEIDVAIELERRGGGVEEEVEEEDSMDVVREFGGRRRGAGGGGGTETSSWAVEPTSS